MFVKSARRWYGGTEQRASGSFLMVFSRKRELRALVRHARLHQFGHFMMGSVVIGGEKLTLSGTYGSDGLPMDASDFIWEHAVPLPQDLTEKFWKGGGHNSAGSEGQAMHDWANANLKTLRKPIKKEKEHG